MLANGRVVYRYQLAAFYCPIFHHIFPRNNKRKRNQTKTQQKKWWKENAPFDYLSQQHFLMLLVKELCHSISSLKTQNSDEWRCTWIHFMAIDKNWTAIRKIDVKIPWSCMAIEHQQARSLLMLFSVFTFKTCFRMLMTGCLVNKSIIKRSDTSTPTTTGCGSHKFKSYIIFRVFWRLATWVHPCKNRF